VKPVGSADVKPPKSSKLEDAPKVAAGWAAAGTEKTDGAGVIDAGGAAEKPSKSLGAVCGADEEKTDVSGSIWNKSAVISDWLGGCGPAVFAAAEGASGAAGARGAIIAAEGADENAGVVGAAPNAPIDCAEENVADEGADVKTATGAEKDESAETKSSKSSAPPKGAGWVNDCCWINGCCWNGCCCCWNGCC